MEYKDYYKVLGVERTADQDSIKQAFRRLAAKYHPDRNQAKGAEERFKEINEANEVLSDTTKRARYDQLGAEWRAGQNFKPPPGWGTSSPHFDSSVFEGSARRGANSQQSSGFSEFFEGLFGGRRASTSSTGASSSSQGASTLQIDVEDIYRGLKTVSLPMGGSVQIRIPPDISDDKRIRIPGKGPHGADVYLMVKIKEHPLYRREGSNIYLDLPISPWEAALGETVTIKTLAGRISLKIPPGSQTGRKMRLKGRGLAGQEQGDLYIVLHVHTPPADTAEQKEYYAQMKALFAWNPRQQMT